VNIKTTLKTSVAAAALFALAAPVVSSPADAGAWNGGNKNKVVMSGRIHRGLLYADDGQSDGLFNTGGGTTSTRLRWIATGQVNESVSVKGLIEMDTPKSANQSGASLGTAGAGTNRSIAGASAWGIRHMDIKFSHKTMGAFSIGQGNTASNGRSEVNFLGTGNVAINGTNFGDGFDFVNSTTKASSGVSIGDIFTNMDGLSRNDRIRYDLPSISGLNLAVSYVDGGNVDMGAGYSAKFGSVSVQAAAQYNNTAATTTTDQSQWSASAAIKHDSGLNLALLYGQTDTNAVGVDATVWAATVGYNAKLNSMGQTGLSAGYQSNTDANSTKGTDGTVWTVAAQQNIDAIGSALWIAYKNFDYDTSGSTNFDDISVVYAGATVNF